MMCRLYGYAMPDVMGCIKGKRATAITRRFVIGLGTPPERCFGPEAALGPWWGRMSNWPGCTFATRNNERHDQMKLGAQPRLGRLTG
ncbi:hypothetical protein TPL01_16650 [Sulfuriferula plumbiphila]|uniref:Uncharacterized protein n=1 Tax=Sulfuriferula plumbiphila TaxID=171865 RepID=A0A512L7T6_9PROT|nr:hypothetical protein SFPGR_13780 [Sulfuriferula plumbiphila]GEP30527.1 hypothetical protein TPL01_16650 [Sulfuriferula plumbiphila]